MVDGDGIVFFNLPYYPFEFSLIDCCPAGKWQCSIDFDLIVCIDVGLVGDSEEVRISGGAVYGVEGRELFVAYGSVYLHRAALIDSFSLSLLQRLYSLASLVLPASLRQHNKIIIKTNTL